MKRILVTGAAGQVGSELVPALRAERVRDELIDRLKAVVVGNPAHEGVRMGPLATAEQKRDVREGVDQLARDGRLVFGSAEVSAVGVPPGKGFFVSPVLLEVEPGAAAPSVHSREVFGPVASVVPYSGAPADAAVPSPLERSFEALDRLGDLQRGMERLRDRLATLSGDDAPVIDAGPPDDGRSPRREE